MPMLMRPPTPYHLMPHTITIKRAVDSTDASNGPVETFVTFKTLKAQVQFSVGSELPVEYGRSAPQRFGTAFCAPNQGVQTKMRLYYNGTEYNITAVRDTTETSTLTRIDFELVQ